MNDQIVNKPEVQLSGQDGNIFNLLGLASRALKRNGQRDKVEEMTKKIMSGEVDYDGAIQVIMEYVDVT